MFRIVIYYSFYYSSKKHCHTSALQYLSISLDKILTKTEIDKGGKSIMSIFSPELLQK